MWLHPRMLTERDRSTSSHRWDTFHGDQCRITTEVIAVKTITYCFILYEIVDEVENILVIFAKFILAAATFGYQQSEILTLIPNKICIYLLSRTDGHNSDVYVIINLRFIFATAITLKLNKLM